MVKGIEKFREYFADHHGKYALIGGAACHLSFIELNLQFRASKDIDMVLCVETVDKGLAETFINFLDAGGYKARERGDGRKEFYRFHKPTDHDFPFMIELLSRRPESLGLPEDAVLAPIPVEDDVTSLSAILLDETYFAALQEHKRLVDDVTIVDQSLLVPFKARAFLNLAESKTTGASVKSVDIKKHREDVFYLTLILPPDKTVELPEKIKADLRHFLQVVLDEDAVDFEKLDIGRSKDEAVDFLRGFYLL